MAVSTLQEQLGGARVTPRPSWGYSGMHQVSSYWAPRITRGAVRQVLVAQVQRSHRRQVQRVLETGCGQAGSRFMRNSLEFRFQLDASHPARRF